MPRDMDSGDVRRRAEDFGGGMNQRPAPVARPAVYEIMRIDDRTDALWIHVELPPVDPQEVIVDLTGDEIDIILPQGTETDIYCSIDVPQGVDKTRMQKTVTRGHLEIVLPKLSV